MRKKGWRISEKNRFVYKKYPSAIFRNGIGGGLEATVIWPQIKILKVDKNVNFNP